MKSKEKPTVGTEEQLTTEAMVSFVTNYLNDCSIESAISILKHSLGNDCDLNDDGEIVMEGEIIEEDCFSDLLNNIIEDASLHTMLDIYGEIHNEEFEITDNGIVVAAKIL